MRRSQLGMSMAYAFFPAQMLTVLPLGWGFYTHGTLAAEVFITVIILSLGMSAPIVAAFNFVDTLAQVGTTAAQVDEILNAEEQVHSETPVTFSDHTVVLKDVRFGYHADQEILHGVSLTIPQNKMTALVGPSGGGKGMLRRLHCGAAAGRRLEAVNQKAQAGAYVLPAPDFLCGSGKRAKTDPASRPDRSPRARAAGAPAL